MRKSSMLKWPVFAALLVFSISLPFDAASAAEQQNVRVYGKGMRLSEFAGRPDSDIIRFQNGRQLNLGELRKLDEMGKQVREARAQRKPLPGALKVVPAKTAMTLKIKTPRDLSDMYTRPDADTMQLPSGRVVTAGQLKFLKPHLEKKLGRRLDAAAARQPLQGSVVVVRSNVTRAEWQEILRKPDNTVLELESHPGKRTTVGSLKKAIQNSKPDMR